ncbi:unnamed protein product [Nezara viridula]|uniref:Uncharacterized protein n=1 Tax=Nezara viridula TaxID=85310 RepID=A0A9P0HBQ7_NEZVI|nr:unnamed protein product [Nezara viridula]
MVPIPTKFTHFLSRENLIFKLFVIIFLKRLTWLLVKKGFLSLDVINNNTYHNIRETNFYRTITKKKKICNKIILEKICKSVSESTTKNK